MTKSLAFISLLIFGCGSLQAGSNSWGTNGSDTFNSITLTGLTTGRCLYTTTGGLLAASQSCLFDGVDLTLSGTANLAFLNVVNSVNPSIKVQTTDTASLSLIHFINTTVQGPFLDFQASTQRFAFGIASNGHWNLRNSTGATDPVNGTTIWDMAPDGSLITVGSLVNTSANGISVTFGITAATVTTTGTGTFGGGIVGTTTNNNAAAGNYGEYASTSSIAFANIAGTGTFGNVVSMALTAGDWDLSGCVTLKLNGAVITDYEVAVSSFTGNTTTDHVEGSNWTESAGFPIATANSSLCVPRFRVTLAGTTTMFIKAKGAFSVATPQAIGTLTARRVR